MNQQSPINLCEAIYADLKHESLVVEWSNDVRGKFEKDEHGFKVKFGGDQRQAIQLSKKEYHLVEFHFHHPSEHWIDGTQQAMELHIVNQNIDDGSRVVFGVFIDAGGSDKPELVETIKALVLDNSDVPGTVISTNPREWLPKNLRNYYRYEGSLTTPVFEENVSWLIFDEHRLIPKEDINALIKVFGHPAKLPQARNRRYLLKSFR